MLIAPLAPHVAEELWRRLGHTESVTSTPPRPWRCPASTPC
ncbi:class I tRNA ligase family protein [Streptomyces microflavus]